MPDNRIHRIIPLRMPWHTQDPFLFCVHHNDLYPHGNEQMGPATSLQGRAMGHDFSGRDGWSMYHGESVPGFPSHPHRGFETITIARRGYIDHSDSLGAAARFGDGDVQWMTAGRGVVHSEMFPLVHRDADNPTELFQIWLNLPRRSKLVEPHFTMFWADQIPRVTFRDADGRATEITMVAGPLEGHAVPAPPPDSWASDPASGIRVWTMRMEANARWTLPASTGARLLRTLYFFDGATMRVAGRDLTPGVGVEAAAEADLEIVNGTQAAELLLLEGAPIGEPVVQHGPFVMNTPEEIQQAVMDYRRTGFGGWPWGARDPVHPREETRFARHPDGRIERPG
jgi:redox-sensitive bicupin YhaK (pirin superfamily)